LEDLPNTWPVVCGWFVKQRQRLSSVGSNKYDSQREMTMHLKVVITKGEDGWYVVTVPALPGCISQGRTIKEAKQNIKEAISLYLEPEEDIIPGKGARVIEVAV
jgi:predicted RNase H-like HicB family nuclease